MCKRKDLENGHHFRGYKNIHFYSSIDSFLYILFSCHWTADMYFSENPMERGLLFLWTLTYWNCFLGGIVCLLLFFFAPLETEKALKQYNFSRFYKNITLWSVGKNKYIYEMVERWNSLSCMIAIMAETEKSLIYLTVVMKCPLMKWHYKYNP